MLGADHTITDWDSPLLKNFATAAALKMTTNYVTPEVS